MKRRSIGLFIGIMLFATLAQGENKFVFRETISHCSTWRTLRVYGDSGRVLYHHKDDGVRDFGCATKSITYSHSILNLTPPITADAELYWLSVKLHFRGCDHKADVDVTIDSLQIDKYHRRIVLNRNFHDQKATVTQSLLDDGLLEICIDANGHDKFVLEWSEMVLAGKFASKLDVEDYLLQTPIPTQCSLGDNFPNPFNPTTQIQFGLPATAQTRIDIINITGQTVRNLIDMYLVAGQHAVIWDGRNDLGESVASGIYFYRLQTKDFVDTKKMVLMK